MPDLETVLTVSSRTLPSLPASYIKKLFDLLPVLVFWGSLMILALSVYFTFFDREINQFDTLIHINYYLGFAFNAVAALILFSSRAPLKKNRLNGWRMLYYLVLIYLLLFVITANIAGLLVLLVAFYLLAQVRPYYS